MKKSSVKILFIKKNRALFSQLNTTADIYMYIFNKKKFNLKNDSKSKAFIYVLNFLLIRLIFLRFAYP